MYRNLNFYDALFGAPYLYDRYVIRKHIDIPEDEEKGNPIVTTLHPKSNSEYKNYPYYKEAHPNNQSSIGYCIGFNVKTIPYGNGFSEKFMPIYTIDSGQKRIDMNVQFKQQYKNYLKKFETKKMWELLMLLMSIDIPTEISFCNKLVSVKSSVPPEIAHIIYEYLV